MSLTVVRLDNLRNKADLDRQLARQIIRQAVH